VLYFLGAIESYSVVLSQIGNTRFILFVKKKYPTVSTITINQLTKFSKLV